MSVCTDYYQIWFLSARSIEFLVHSLARQSASTGQPRRSFFPPPSWLLDTNHTCIDFLFGKRTKKLKIDFEVIAFYTCIQRQKRTSTISKSILHTRPPFFFPPLSFQLLSPELDSVVPQSDNYLNLLVRSSRQDRFLLRRFSFTFYFPFTLLKFMNCEHFFTCARVFGFSIFSVAMRRAVPFF